jgi:hypothetical protein
MILLKQRERILQRALFLALAKISQVVVDRRLNAARIGNMLKGEIAAGCPARLDHHIAKTQVK